MINDLSYVLHHHAIKIGDDRYYSVFIVNNWRHEVETRGTQEVAMQKAYNECLRWLDKVIDTDATFAVYSNAKEIASIQAGAITLVDADLLEKINETIQITEQEELKEIQKAERLAKRLARKKT